MRIGGLRLGIGVALAALAVAACSKGMLMSDVGTVSGGSGTTGATGQAGAAGAGHATGTGGHTGCTTADVFTVCDADIAEPPIAGTAGASCSAEGVHCEGYSCNDPSSGFAWEATCCFGVWLNISGRCPALGDSSRLAR